MKINEFLTYFFEIVSLFCDQISFENVILILFVIQFVRKWTFMTLLSFFSILIIDTENIVYKTIHFNRL